MSCASEQPGDLIAGKRPNSGESLAELIAGRVAGGAVAALDRSKEMAARQVGGSAGGRVELARVSRQRSPLGPVARTHIHYQIGPPELARAWIREEQP